MTFPMPMGRKIKEFASKVEKLYVIEERIHIWKTT